MEEITQNSIPKRSEISEEFKWKLEKLYESDEQWSSDFDFIRKRSDQIKALAGKLGESPETLYELLKLQDELSQRMENVFVYARMRKDEDNTVARYQAASDKAQSLSVEVNSSLSFIVPEIISIDESRIKKFL